MMRVSQGGNAMKINERKDDVQKFAPCGASECGATHGDCPNTWQGTCDREAGHDGSHHCSRCNAAF
jgi:hypothetical protein